MKKYFLIVTLLAGLWLVLASLAVSAQQVPVQDPQFLSDGTATPILCSSCYSYKGGKNHCFKCGESCTSNQAMVVMCHNCYEYRGGKDHCFQCGSSCSSSSQTVPIMCHRCYDSMGGGSHCIKCGSSCY